VDAQLEGTRTRLANAAFVSRAPADVVEKERDRAGQLEEQASKLREKLAMLEVGGP
jgi:valyl-tRNA synthetase